MAYNLLDDGDNVEQQYFRLFIEKEFINYEKFWARYIVPLTNRPRDIHFKTDPELVRMERGANDVCVAQLHYTILLHLIRAYDIRQQHPLPLSSARDQFMEGIVRLCAAVDVAHELLERMRSPTAYDPWDENDGERARRAWRAQYGNPLRPITKYRNKLIHGRVSPSIVVLGATPRFRFPTIGSEDRYIDWRPVTSGSIGNGGTVRNSFDSPENILNYCWQRVLGHLQGEWSLRLPI